MFSFNRNDFSFSRYPKLKDSWVKNFGNKIDYVVDFRDYYMDEKFILFNYPDSIKKISDNSYEIISDLIIDNTEDGDPIILTFNSSLKINSRCYNYTEI